MFISRSETLKFVAGQTVVLPCDVANTGEKFDWLNPIPIRLKSPYLNFPKENYIVAWKRGIAILSAGTVKVTPDPRFRLINGYSLEIRDASPQDAGDYICQIATLEPREITHTVEILGELFGKSAGFVHWMYRDQRVLCALSAKNRVVLKAYAQFKFRGKCESHP